MDVLKRKSRSFPKSLDRFLHSRRCSKSLVGIVLSFAVFAPSMVLAQGSVGTTDGPHLVASLPNTSEPVSADPSSKAANWRQSRIDLEFQFGEELAQIGLWCRENGINQQVEPTYQLKMRRDLLRQYIFPASTKTMPRPEEQQDEKLAQWLDKINTAKRNHAGRIFELAEKAANEDAGGVAFQLLHEVIFYDRDHERARGMLGHRKKANQWHLASDSISVRPATRDHDIFEMPAGGYLRVSSPHFEIDSTVGEERTLYLAQQLERWHDVWRQVFFEYWCSPTFMKKLFDGKTKRVPAYRTKFRVLFLRNKAEYLVHLGGRVRHIERSNGYYSNTEEISIFYDGGPLEHDTWKHELTHQMFRESKNTRRDAFEESGFWIDEGVACYFESVRDFGDYLTVGGFDSRRLQFARLRHFLENYHVKLGELTALGRTAFQSRSDMELMYGESAAIVEMMMNDGGGAYEAAFVKFLDLVFERQPKQNALEQLVGESFDKLDLKFEQFLKVDSDRVVWHLESPTTQEVLSLSNSNLDTKAFDAIGKCTQLAWLDLSGNTITRQRLNALEHCDQLTQLFLTECKFGEDALSGLAVLDSLQELDLSGSAVTDADLAGLAKCNSLTSVQLVATRVSDAGLAELAKIPNLRLVGLSNTRVSQEAMIKLKAAKPFLIFQ